jgi:uncharacterized protein
MPEEVPRSQDGIAHGCVAPDSMAWNRQGKVHLFDKFDRRFVLDVGSGTVSELDEVAWGIVSRLAEGETPVAVRERFARRYGIDAVDNALAELDELYDAGELFSPDPMPTREIRTASPVSSLCLIMAEHCNLRCDYCFICGDSAQGKRRMMTAETAKAAVDFLLEASCSTADVSISYFGGEPLLNFPVIQQTTCYAVEAGRALGIQPRFNITTNATHLDGRVRDFLAAYSQVSVILSVDGGPELHDRHRRYVGGHGSYATVRRNVEALLADDRLDHARFSLRGTFTNVDHDLTRAAAELLTFGLPNLSVEPAIVRDTRLEITDRQLQVIKRDYDRLALFYVGAAKRGEPFEFFHFQSAVGHVVSPTRQCRPCGAGIGYLAVAADGTLFPCHRFVGDGRFALGNVWEGIEQSALADLFASIDVNRKEKCRTCWAKYFCGGGCHRHAEEFNHDLCDPYRIECELVKHRVELGCYIWAELMEEGPAQVRWSRPNSHNTDRSFGPSHSSQSVRTCLPASHQP